MDFRIVLNRQRLWPLSAARAKSLDRARYSILMARLQVIRFLLLAGFVTVAWSGKSHAAVPASEYALLRKFPPSILAPFIENQPDSQGFVGFHQRDGKWYEAGMQRGGCWMLIGAVVAGDRQRADKAWQSIEVTFEHQVADGGFVSNPKPGQTTAPTFDERVETAYFFLQELGHAILVIRASPLEPHFRERIEALEPKLRRACAFMQSGYDGIIRKAGHTANRMFIAAKAFGLCGVILNAEELKSSSRKLVAAALARRDADGVFIENRGRDSSYNAVAILMAQVLALYQPDPDVDAALARATAWQRTRIKPSGEVEVAGNTRTGLGQEQMMGHPKNVNYREVTLALCYFGMVHDDLATVALAEKVQAWAGRVNR